MQALLDRIAARRAEIGVVGLGTVGVTVACAFARAGFRVRGVDRQAARAELVSRGACHLGGEEPELAGVLADVVARGRLSASTAWDELRTADIVIVAVDTPIDAAHAPRLEALEAACRDIGRVLASGALVVVESTVAPGTMLGRVRPWLEQASGRTLAAGGFLLGHCPERVMRTRLLANVRGMSRVCGGATPDATRAMLALYRTIVDAELDAADCATAELVKTGENAFRDVAIAFANELALACERAGADFLEVRRLINKAPDRNVHFAGAGVGGHCMPKDSWLLAAGLDAPLVRAARAVNDAMPAHVADLLARALAARGVPLAGARVAILGRAYLANTDDVHGSPTDALVAILAARGAEALVHDPFVPGHAGDPYALASGAHAAVLMTAHAPYAALDLARLARALAEPVFVDGRFAVDPAAARAAGLAYVGVGRG